MNHRRSRLYSLVVVLGMVALTTYSAPASFSAMSQRAMSPTSAFLPSTSRSDAPLVASSPPRASAQLGRGLKGGRQRAGLTIDPLAAGSGRIALAVGRSPLSLSALTHRASGGQLRVVAPQNITVSSGSSATSCSRLSALGTGTPGDYAAVRVWTIGIDNSSGTPLIDSYTNKTSQGAGASYTLIGSDGTFHVEAGFTAQTAGTTIEYRIYDAPSNTYSSYDGGTVFNTTVTSCTPQAPINVSSATTYCSLLGAHGTGTPGQYAAVEVFADPSGSRTPLIRSYANTGAPTYYAPIGSDGAFNVTAPFAAQPPGAMIRYVIYDAPLNTFGSYDSGGGTYDTTVACTQDPATPAAQTAAAQTAAAQTSVAQTSVAQTAAAQTAAAQQTATAVAQTAAAQTATVAAQTSVAQTAAAQTAAAQTAAAQTAAAQTAAAQTAVAQTARAQQTVTAVAQTAAAQTSVAQTAAAQTAAVQTAAPQQTATAAAQTAAVQTSVAQTAAAQTAAAGTAAAAPTSVPATSVPAKTSTLPTATDTPMQSGPTETAATATTDSGSPSSPTPAATAIVAPPSTRCLRPSSGQVATGGTLTVQVCTAPRAAVTLTLQVLGPPIHSGKGHGHGQPPAVLYSVAVTGRAGALGRFTGQLHITYRVKGTTPARLTLRTAGYVLTTTVRLTPA